MQMLVALHRAGGRTVTKQQLIASCWDGLAVSDDAITQCIWKLRRALARVPEAQVSSVPRLGYRLDAPRAGSGPGGQPRFDRRRVLIAGAGTAAAAGLGWLVFDVHTPAPGNSIAVLPFANLSGDTRQAYFGDGIAEEVRNALSRMAGLNVVGRTSSEAVRDIDAATVARRLHVSNVLIGSVRRSASMTRVSAQLVDGRSGFQLWSQSYDLASMDALELQREIAQNVALALRLKLERSETAAIAAGGTASAIANELYHQAKREIKSSDTEASFRKVIVLCDAAIGIDPRYADAYALKGMAWDAIGSSFVEDPAATHRAYAQGAEAARTAITIAPQVADGYVALGRSMSGQLDVRGALEQYRKAGSLARADPGILSWWVHTLAEIGRTTEAIALSEKLIALDPLNPALFGKQAFAYFFARRYERAIQSSRRALALAPGLTEQESLVGDCLCLLGRYPEALVQYSKAPPLDLFRITGEGLVAARQGDQSSAHRVLDRLHRDFGQTSSYQVAQIHAQLNRFDEAFLALETGRSVLDAGLNSLPADPFIDPLRGDDRFGVLLKQLDLG